MKKVSVQCRHVRLSYGSTEVLKDVDLDITAKREGSTISVLTSYSVKFADWGIDDPSFGPAQVEDNALLEIKLVFERA